MMRKKLYGTILLALSLAVFTLISGCSNATKPAATGETKPQEEKVKKLSITYVKSPLNVPSIIEKKKGLFEKEFGPDGIELTFPEITAGSKQTEAIAAGELDFANALGGTSAILAAANGVDLKVIGIYSRAPKAFMILTKSPEIKTAADLKGKKVGGPKGTILHQLLVTALVKNNLKPEDVQYVSMDIPAAVSAMQNGSIDAALVAGPAALKATKAGARVVTTGEGLVEGTIVVGVRGELLREQPDLVKRFNKVQGESLTFIKENQEEAFSITAEETGLTVDEVKLMYPWYDFSPEVKPSDIEELKKTQDFLVENGLLQKTINIEDLIVSIK